MNKKYMLLISVLLCAPFNSYAKTDLNAPDLILYKIPAESLIDITASDRELDKAENIIKQALPQEVTQYIFHCGFDTPEPLKNPEKVIAVAQNVLEEFRDSHTDYNVRGLSALYLMDLESCKKQHEDDHSFAKQIPRCKTCLVNLKRAFDIFGAAEPTDTTKRLLEFIDYRMNDPRLFYSFGATSVKEYQQLIDMVREHLGIKVSLKAKQLESQSFLYELLQMIGAF